MLERTVATLEPCHLQRAIPVHALKSHRHLSTCFWQHAVADVELFDACQTMLRNTLPAPSTTQPPSDEPRLQTRVELQKSSMIASTFLLEFLYPRGAISLFRHVAPNMLSRTRASGLTGLVPPVQVATVSTSRPIEGSRPEEHIEMEARRGNSSGRDVMIDAFAPGPVDSTPSTHRKVGPDALRQMLWDKSIHQSYEAVWSLYQQLADVDKEKVMPDVLVKLSKSHRLVEQYRVLELYAQLSSQRWTEGVVRAAVRAAIQTQDIKRAMDMFKAAWSAKCIIQPLDNLLAHALSSSDWDLALAVLQVVVGSPFMDTARIQLTEETVPLADVSRSWAKRIHAYVSFPRLAKLENLQDKIERLSQHADARDGLDGARNHALGVGFVIALAVRGSLEQFRPHDAIALVERSCDLLYGYPKLVSAFFTRHERDLSVEYYLKYRALPGSRIIPSHLPRVLGSLLKDDLDGYEVKGIDELYRDWRLVGDDKMTRSICQQLLGYYAAQGNAVGIIKLIERHGSLLPKDSFSATETSSVSQSTTSVPMVVIDAILTRGNREVFVDFLRLYARRGDVNRIRTLIAKATDWEPKTQGSAPTSITKKAAEEPVELSAQPDVVSNQAWKPTTAEYNVLLQAHVSNRDYEGAINVFNWICDYARPDLNSFIPIMQLAGSLADLDFCLELYKLAKDYRLKPSVHMIDTLVDAYCRVGQFHDAITLCRGTTRRNTFSQDVVILWNTLLRHHGHRRDLQKVHRYLGLMTEYGVNYTAETYDCLLTALVNCRQSQHAARLMQVAETEKLFEPTAHHYLLLMTAFIRSGEPYRALLVYQRLIDGKKHRVLASHMTQAIQAYGKIANNLRTGQQNESLPDGRAKDSQWFVEQALTAFQASMGGEDRHPENIRDATLQYAKIVSILGQARDMKSARKVVDEYRRKFNIEEDRALPLHLLSSMMLADYYDGNHAQAKATFNLILYQLRVGARPAEQLLSEQEESGSSQAPRDLVDSVGNEDITDPFLPVHPTVTGVSPIAPDLAGFSVNPEPPDPELPTLPQVGPTFPAYPVTHLIPKMWREAPAAQFPHHEPRGPQILRGLRQYINEPLKTMQRILVLEQDPWAMRKLIMHLINLGFKIDNYNWNYFVQAQARLKSWYTAFRSCEVRLMHRYEGWAQARELQNRPRRSKLTTRHFGLAPYHLRPISHTLLILAKEYGELERMAPYSFRAARLLSVLDNMAPNTVRAVKGLIRDPRSRLEQDILERDAWEPEWKELGLGKTGATHPTDRPTIDEDILAGGGTEQRKPDLSFDLHPTDEADISEDEFEVGLEDEQRLDESDGEQGPRMPAADGAPRPGENDEPPRKYFQGWS